jgi:hypothetical protein
MSGQIPVIIFAPETLPQPSWLTEFAPDWGVSAGSAGANRAEIRLLLDLLLPSMPPVAPQPRPSRHRPAPAMAPAARAMLR